jgi:predicted nucleic acid-binding Zn ribbon protein
MLLKKESQGMPEHYVCTNCGHTERVKQSITGEGKQGDGKRTLVD